MDIFELNQFMLGLVLLFNLLVLINGQDYSLLINECSNGDTHEALICVFTNLYIWMLIVNCIYLIYIICIVISAIKRSIRNIRYRRQIDHDVAPPV
jgi:hypothetical protein